MGEAGSWVVGWCCSRIAGRGTARRLMMAVVGIGSMRVGGWCTGVGIAGVGSMRRIGGRCSLVEEEGRNGWVGRSLKRTIDWSVRGLCRMGFGSCSRLVGRLGRRIGIAGRTCLERLDAAVRMVVLRMCWSLADGLGRSCSLERSCFLRLGMAARSGRRKQRNLRIDLRFAGRRRKMVRPEIAAGAECLMTRVDWGSAG